MSRRQEDEVEEVEVARLEGWQFDGGRMNNKASPAMRLRPSLLMLDRQIRNCGLGLGTVGCAGNVAGNNNDAEMVVHGDPGMCSSGVGYSVVLSPIAQFVGEV